MRYDLDAKLNDWAMVEIDYIDKPGSGWALMGFVEGDRNGRWPDGQLIMTSDIERGQCVGPGATVRTRNNVYLLGAERKPTDLN